LIRRDFQSRPERAKGKAGMNHHFDRGADSDVDPASWNRASYNHHPRDDFEPLPDAANDYRQAAVHLQLMFAVDEFVTAAPDARVAVVAVVLGWPSARGLSVRNIAGQLGCSQTTITQACARFREMSGRDSSGGVRFIRPGAGSNGDKPAAVQA
jgi:hypothetical protein